VSAEGEEFVSEVLPGKCLADHPVVGSRPLAVSLPFRLHFAFDVRVGEGVEEEVAAANQASQALPHVCDGGGAIDAIRWKTDLTIELDAELELLVSIVDVFPSDLAYDHLRSRPNFGCVWLVRSPVAQELKLSSEITGVLLEKVAGLVPVRIRSES
jgi:hypothetical protein